MIFSNDETGRHGMITRTIKNRYIRHFSLGDASRPLCPLAHRRHLLFLLTAAEALPLPSRQPALGVWLHLRVKIQRRLAGPLFALALRKHLCGCPVGIATPFGCDTLRAITHDSGSSLQGINFGHALFALHRRR